MGATTQAPPTPSRASDKSAVLTRIPRDLKRAIAMRAVLEERTISSVVADAIALYIDNTPLKA